MAKRKMSKQSKRRLFFFGTISVAVIVYAIFMTSYYVVNIYKLKKEEATLKTNLNELKHNEKLLNTEIDKLKDNEYIARYARENYSYSKNGEIIIKMDDKKKKNKDEAKYDIDYEKVISISIITLIIIILYVLVKSKKKKKKK